MANLLYFVVKTDAPYTDRELGDLTDEFEAFIRKADSDVLDVEDVEIVDASEPRDSVSDDKKREIVLEFLKTAGFSLSLDILDDDGDSVHAVSLSD